MEPRTDRPASRVEATVAVAPVDSSVLAFGAAARRRSRIGGARSGVERAVALLNNAAGDARAERRRLPTTQIKCVQRVDTGYVLAVWISRSRH